MTKPLNVPTFSPRQIVVRMPNWLGDLVMATPILTDLRNHWPEANIIPMCQGILGTVIQEDPHINSIFPFKRPTGWFDREASQHILSFLKRSSFDLGILLTNSFSSALWFKRGKVEERIGFAGNGRSWLLNQPVSFPNNRKTQHLVKTYKELLTPLGIPISSTSPRLYVTPQERQNARVKLEILGVESKDLLIGINPGAAYGSAKCWLPDRFKKLSQLLLENKSIKIIYFGDKAGAPLVQEICKDLPDRVINLAAQTTLRELMALIEACHLFVTNDSGPMHAASALGVPLIALFGSTSDAATGPYAGGHVIHKHVPCSPCYRRECPLIDFICMKKIEVSEVYDEILRYVSR